MSLPADESREPLAESRSPSAESREPRAASLALLITLASGIVRLLVAALTPVFPDETYYWEWSRHLAAGYFDHPPAIALLIRIGTLLAGDTPLGVRLGCVVAGVVAAFFLMASARRIGGDRAALLTAVVFAVMPLSAAGLVLATPDAPLLAGASATVYALVRVLEHPPRSRDSLMWWYAAGAALGLAFCAKYTAVLLPLGVLTALLSRRALRDRFREPGPYAAAAIALVVFLPVVLWNARHGWISFAFQLQHGFGTASGSILKRELDFIGGQAGLVSPILFVLMLVSLGRELRYPRAESREPRAESRQILTVIPLVVFAFFMYSATKRRVEANWPALAYVPAILLLVTRGGGRVWDRWMRSGIGLAAVLTLVAYVNAFIPILPVPARRDPNARASGWDSLARVVDRVYTARRPVSSQATWVAGDRYQEASALAFHLPGHPLTFSLNLTSRPNQYDLWPSFADRAHRGDGLVLVVDDMADTHPAAAKLESHFDTMRRGEQVQLMRNGDLVKNLRIWIFDGWRGTWP